MKVANTATPAKPRLSRRPIIIALVLVLGLAGIAHVHDKAQIAAVAEVDAALLADDLPPAAYTDPGFAEYLKTNRE